MPLTASLKNFFHEYDFKSTSTFRKKVSLWDLRFCMEEIGLINNVQVVKGYASHTHWAVVYIQEVWVQIVIVILIAKSILDVENAADQGLTWRHWLTRARVHHQQVCKPYAGWLTQWCLKRESWMSYFTSTTWRQHRLPFATISTITERTVGAFMCF